MTNEQKDRATHLAQIAISRMLDEYPEMLFTNNKFIAKAMMLGVKIGMQVAEETEAAEAPGVQ
jgi:hypothetical protein